MKQYVYVAGPYTGDEEKNVSAAMDAATEIRSQGYIPFIPHLYHFWDQRMPQDYNYWMELCLAWLVKCHIMVRLPGESNGADIEEQLANGSSIRVLHGMDEFRKYAEVQL